MLKRYKNALFDAAQKAGVDITRLRGIEAEMGGYATFTIQYKETPLKFVVRQSNDDPDAFDYAFTRVGTKQPQALTFMPSNEWLTFAKLSDKFKAWASREVRIAIDEDLLPDLWSMLSDGEILSGDAEATPFTDDERAQLKLALRTFKSMVAKEFKTQEPQRAIIAEHIDYLASAVDRLNRFDWRGVAISTLMSISVALSLDTDRGRQLYALFQQALSSVFHLLK